ncbi:hypothetical protein F5Y17DRAFT_382399 [Xylariaceae sp. FL0594]|nr:hypothetical protein F5Y17DRAFT_382399 [Xylariaceae sp. FL0594]
MISNLAIVLLALPSLGVLASDGSAASYPVSTHPPGICGPVQINDPSSACLELRNTVSGQYGSLMPADGEVYTDAEDENYSTLCRLPAACIVQPKSADEVATALRVLIEGHTKFAIRSGGHNYVPGFASINETGALISLSALKSIDLSEDKKTVRVGPGNKWIEVYKALTPQGLTVVGGRVGPVGVGGLILGGGVNYFSSEYGLALDNVKSFEIVLANGSIIIASSEGETADLYKALRGGGSNFGIVTSYELYTHPLGTLSVEARAYNVKQTDTFLQAFAEYQNKEKQHCDDGKGSSVTVQILPTGPTLLLVYAGATRPDAFKPFYDIVPFETLIDPTHNATLLDVLALSDSRFEYDVRVYGETFSHLAAPTYDLLNDLFDIFLNETAELPQNVTAVWVPNPISANVAVRGRARGGNVLNLREEAQVWYESFITYTDPAHDDIVRDVTQRFTDKCIAAIATAHARRGGVGGSLAVPYLFANTAGGRQKVLQSYGNETVAYLKRMAAKYDPECVFQTLQNDGFLLRDV